MPTEPVVVDIPPNVYRVCRAKDPLRFSRISPEDNELDTAGNRFDVPGGGVLYAATGAAACYGETLARMRPTPKIRDLLKGETGFMVAGGVPQDWRLQRVLATIETADALPFLDVEAADTATFLSEQLAPQLAALGYTDNLDVAAIRGPNRLISRAIARYAYTASNELGELLYGGVRYLSRLDTAWECWAIFEGTSLEVGAQAAIEAHDPHLLKLAAKWDLRIF